MSLDRCGTLQIFKIALKKNWDPDLEYFALQFDIINTHFQDIWFQPIKSLKVAPKSAFSV